MMVDFMEGIINKIDKFRLFIKNQIKFNIKSNLHKLILEIFTLLIIFICY